VDKKKLIVVWPYRFRDFDWQRFELEQLSQHVEVQVHELIDALTPEFAAAYANQSERPEVKRFSSLRDWRREFKKISEDSIIFTHIRPTNPKSTFVCITLATSKMRVVSFLLGGPVLPVREVSGAPQKLKSLFQKTYHFLRRNLLAFVMPDLLAIAGLESERLGKRDFSRGTKLIAMHSFDFESFLGMKEYLEPKNVAVFLDTGFPGFIRDEALTGRRELVSEKQWYPSLNTFFTALEKFLGASVEIAEHPKHVGRDHSRFFGSRVTIGNKTIDMVASSSFVIATNSTAISYAICFGKPLILVTCDAVEESGQRKRIQIANSAKETGAKIFNIDREYTEKELREALVIDHAKRESYKRKYLTSRTDDKPNYQVLLDEVINAVD